MFKYLSGFLFILPFISCSKDVPIVDITGSSYPENVGKLLLTKCAVPGCHNNISKDAAAGLSLQTWNKMFEGTKNGPVVIPYRPDFSTLCFYVNTFPQFGPSLKPTMPINAPALTQSEYIILRDWIAKGAADSKGFIKFSDNPHRKKFYVSNRLCDVVTVLDQKTLSPMRYIDVGKTAVPEFPDMIKVSPDGQYWYVSFSGSSVIQKFRTSDDAYIGEIYLSWGSWQTFVITPDSKNAFCADYNSPGKIAYLDLQNMTVLAEYANGGNFKYPHGLAINQSSTVLYAGAQYGNYIYKIDITNPYSPVIQEKTIDGTGIPIYNFMLDPYELSLSPDENKYYVTCQNSNEIRVVQTSNDSLISVIAAEYYPQQMCFAESFNYLFVSCPEDSTSFPGLRSSILVINYTTNTLIKKIYAGFQSYGLSVDDDSKIVCVSNMNIRSDGVAPHHTTNCGGRNGYVTFIDMNSLTLLPKKVELANLPYSVAVRK